MDWIAVPREKQLRLIINTDAKNEADDQYAIVHALLSPSLDIKGIIPAHFGTLRTDKSMEESRDEVMLLLDLMKVAGRVRIADGASLALRDEQTPQMSAGAQLIIDEVMREDDERDLCLMFIGPLTDLASALLIEPRIAERPCDVVWLGGGVWPDGGFEFNLSNDIAAANVVFRSKMRLNVIPMNAFAQALVSFAELYERVYPYGEIGRYLVEQLVEHDDKLHPNRSWEFHVLCDSCALGLILNPLAGSFEWHPAPVFTPEMKYERKADNRTIRIYSRIDSRFIFEDFFAKLARFARKSREGA